MRHSDRVIGANHPNGPLRCEHGRAGHCCTCQDCGRHTREPGWCARCGQFEDGIGWDNVCTPCADEMRLTGL